MDRKELEAIVIKAVATIYGKDEAELSMATNIKEELDEIRHLLSVICDTLQEIKKPLHGGF
jgi:hypothetical protein